MLLGVAARSIEHGLNQGSPLEPDPRDYPDALQAERATFVTLEIHGALRGCIGMLEAIRPLVLDVAHNAFAAAFRDPRFPPLTRAELPRIEIHISVLTPPQTMRFSSEADLLGQIRPGIDGLILEDRGRRGTFLPSVWEQLPDPREFLEHLRYKAGLPGGYWSDTLAVSRYTTESFGTSIDEAFGEGLRTV
ncbi:AmmeMemoRadiSam system protein A [Thiocapsa bogorovii]|uniref:AmmeMemoRadiSam system protein A n=1 Tax=Thiocapsa bogorovii TaxID=521689 RepID=UPI001E2C4A44|nr:AmmeMemoRadiSam system protein A [Thiocapsa bogorovii]UHD15218.1 AmmeMemoRadiSam system protein A [Thiocapsa bogorovii]